MKSILLHIFGPFAINSYGFFVALGLVFTMFVMKRHPLFMQIKLQDYFESITGVIAIAAFTGARALYVISDQQCHTSWVDFFAFWHGGLSILGGILGALIGAALYLKYLKISLLPFFDLVSIHAGLLQGVARIGCFYAGCCYGK